MQGKITSITVSLLLLPLMLLSCLSLGTSFINDSRIKDAQEKFPFTLAVPEELPKDFEFTGITVSEPQSSLISDYRATVWFKDPSGNKITLSQFNTLWLIDLKSISSLNSFRSGPVFGFYMYDLNTEAINLIFPFDKTIVTINSKSTLENTLLLIEGILGNKPEVFSEATVQEIPDILLTFSQQLVPQSLKLPGFIPEGYTLTHYVVNLPLQENVERYMVSLHFEDPTMEDFIDIQLWNIEIDLFQSNRGESIEIGNVTMLYIEEQASGNMAREVRFMLSEKGVIIRANNLTKTELIEVAKSLLEK